METIDGRVLAMVSTTLLTRLTAHLEREGILPRGWTAAELRAAAEAADLNVSRGTNPALHTEFAAALRRIATMCLQAPAAPSDGA